MKLMVWEDVCSEENICSSWSLNMYDVYVYSYNACLNRGKIRYIEMLMFYFFI